MFKIYDEVTNFTSFDKNNLKLNLLGDNAKSWKLTNEEVSKEMYMYESKIGKKQYFIIFTFELNQIVILQDKTMTIYPISFLVKME